MTVGQLLSSPERTVHIALRNTKQGEGKHFVDRCTVTLRCDVFPLTTDVASLRRSPHHLAGLLTVLVANGYNIPGAGRDAASYVRFTFGRREYCTPVVCDAPSVDSANPVYDAVFFAALGSEEEDSIADTPIVLVLVNGKEEIGLVSVEYSKLLGSKNLTVESTSEVGQGASIKFSVSLRGVSYEHMR